MLSNISAVQLGIVLLIVILIFGTKKLANLGKDVGEGIAGIREGFGGDLDDAAEEIVRTKKSLEELKSKVNGLSSADVKDGGSSQTTRLQHVDFEL